MLEVAIRQIPQIPMIVEIPAVFSPRISPSNIKMAASNAITIPIIHCAKNAFFFLSFILSSSSFTSFRFVQTNNAITTNITPKC